MKSHLLFVVLAAGAIMSATACSYTIIYNNVGGSSTSPGTGGASTSSGTGSSEGSAPCSPLPSAPDYSVCHGSTFFPDGSCAQGSCATGPLESRVFAEWKKQILAASKLSEKALWDRVQIARVELIDGTVAASVQIDFVTVLDWVRTRETESIYLGSDPLQSPPSDAAIAIAVSVEIVPEQWHALGSIATVTPVSKALDALGACHCGMNVDWCDISWFFGASTSLGVEGYAIVDEMANSCVRTIVDVTKAESWGCYNEQCGVN